MVDESRTPDFGDPTDSANAQTEVQVDRRRPGRINYIDKNLIALLRRSEASDLAASSLVGAAADDAAAAEVAGPDWEQENDRSDLGPAQGLALALLIVAPFWAGVAALCSWLLRLGR